MDDKMDGIKACDWHRAVPVRRLEERGNVMKNHISKINTIWNRLFKKTYRDAFVSEVVNRGISTQLYSMRMSRGWTQSDLSEKSGMAQPRISKLEDNCDSVNLRTLKRLANAFDVALVVKFVPFSEFTFDAIRRENDKDITSFSNDSIHLVKNIPNLTFSAGGAGKVVLTSKRFR